MDMNMLMEMDKLGGFSPGDPASFLDNIAELPFLDFNISPVFDAIPANAAPPATNHHPSSLMAAAGQEPTMPPCVPGPASSHKRSSVAAMREMIFRIAVMQPIHIDPESLKAPKRRNVKISKDPQSVAARHRRERISQRIRILQRLVPGGTKMDTASMLDEAIHYLKFLKTQVQSLERAAAADRNFGIGLPAGASGSYFSVGRGYQPTQILSPAQLLS